MTAGCFNGMARSLEAAAGRWGSIPISRRCSIWLSPASQKVMSSRAVSADPKQVVLYAREFLAGLRSAGVIGAGKHFPGLGEANLDTHHELPSVNKPFRELWNEDLVPYRSLRRELPMVLVGHANYSAVRRDETPASLSKKWITDILRKKIGYRGLIVSDDLEMGGVLKAGSIEHAVVEHIRAGGDLCLICRQEELVIRGYEALVKEAERDRKFARRVKQSAARVFAFKKKARELRKRVSAPTASTVTKTFAPAVGIRRASQAGKSEAAGTRMIVAGVMSGTSADGINVALVRIVSAARQAASTASPSKVRSALQWHRPVLSLLKRQPRGDGLHIKLLGHAEFPYPKDVRNAVLSAMNSTHAQVADLARLNFLLGELYADRCITAQRRLRVKAELVGCHGQTLYHQGDAEEFLRHKLAVTWQTGEGAVVAARVGVPVVSDFRPADMAAGGKGRAVGSLPRLPAISRRAHRTHRAEYRRELLISPRSRRAPPPRNSPLSIPVRETW